jgi:type VI secretion system secreted protein VgrG
MSTLPEAHATAALISQGSTASYLFTISGAECELSVVSFDVEEQISSPFEIDLTVATQDEVVLEDLLDKKGLLTVICGSSKRYFHGVVRECTCLGDNGGYSIFQIFLVPAVWLLSLEQDCRIFQDMNTQDIICKILEESGITGDRVRLALVVTERKRKYCVQYRETDLNFITRLLEDEGIFYFFEHYKDKHVIVFADNQAAYLKMQGETQIRFNISGGNVPEKESVTDFVYSRRLYPGKVTQRDFNYKRINLDLTINKETKKRSEREVYDYPGNYFKQKKGSVTTQIHQERIQVTGETAEGQSNCPRLTPGSVWQLTNSDFEGEYLTVGVSHTGSQPQVLGEYAGNEGFSYANSFVVIPSEVMIRPQLVAERPIISGIQTATVVGRKGEEIQTDDLGRVLVQFHWDRLGKKDDKSSCWIRVAQSWGGLSRGAQYIPRIGDEVLIEFAEGDPDRPIITGSVYNGDNMPINSLKKSITQSGFRTKTHKGKGFHELRFDDAKGKEEIYLQSEKDWNILVKNNEAKTVGNALVNRAGKTATIIAGEQLHLICGNAGIVLDQSGKIVIHGTEIFVSSTGALHLDGKPIQLNMGGAAGISAAMMPAMQAVTGSARGNAAPAPAFSLPSKPPVFNNHASARANPPGKTKKTGLGKDVDVLAGKSPNMQKNVDTFIDKNGGTIQYGPAGKGSYFDRKKSLIVIDGALKGKPEASTQVLAHELGHAVDTKVTDTTSRAGYIDSMLRGEGDAALANLEARKEILANGGPDIGVAGARSADYEKIYTKYGSSEKASQAIGKVFGDKEITSTTKEVYKDYYGKIFDAKYSKKK